MRTDHCPCCGERITPEVYITLRDQGDYKPSEFECNCPCCGKALEVVVEAVPEFNFFKRVKRLAAKL